MKQPLPTGNFKWLSPDTDLNTLTSSKGYIIEVDLHYPTHLKDLHCELPMAPNHFNGKLSPNLFSKYNYKTSLDNLKFYVENGLIINKIHAILEFDQSCWLEPYINLNSELRKKTKDESARNFYKLMNNAV